MFCFQPNNSTVFLLKKPSASIWLRGIDLFYRHIPADLTLQCSFYLPEIPFHPFFLPLSDRIGYPIHSWGSLLVFILNTGSFPSLVFRCFRKFPRVQPLQPRATTIEMAASENVIKSKWLQSLCSDAAILRG